MARSYDGAVKLSGREIRLIEILLDNPDGLTADNLAEQLGVSARTVHRDLRPAEEFLAPHGLALVKKSGQGMRAEGTEEARERARDVLRETHSTTLAPEQRRLRLLSRLLGSGEPVKLRALASGLKVSTGTVSRDLDEAERWLGGFRLSLARKPGYGVEILGAEGDFRRAMSHLILRSLDETALLSRQSGDPVAERVAEHLRGLIDEERLRRVEALTVEVLNRLPYAVADSAYAGLSVHVALMVERRLRGGEIKIDDDTLRQLRQTEEYEHARSLAETIERDFHVNMPEEEVAYITTHLRGAKLRQGDALERYFESSDLETASRVKALVHYVEEQTGVSLTGDSLLYTGLLAHLERAMYRLRENMRISNPLLSEVRRDYPALFDLVSRGMEKVFVGEDVPDEELGFVAMHFGAALDRGQESLPRRVLVICSAGIGSAMMLGSRLEKAFPQIRQIRNTSLFELDLFDVDEFDLVVSTVPLPISEGLYVQVQPFLSGGEIERIRDHLRESSLNARLAERAASESLEVFGGGQAKFHQMAEATQTIAELVDEVFLARHEVEGSISEAVRQMCDSLASRGIASDTAPLEAALHSRMELGGIGIPQTTLALFHARDGSVARPAFSVHDFDAPLEIEGMDGEMMRVRRSLLMVAPMELSPVALEAISEISVALVEQPLEREILESGSEARIVEALQSIFARYLQNKLS